MNTEALASKGDVKNALLDAKSLGCWTRTLRGVELGAGSRPTACRSSADSSDQPPNRSSAPHALKSD